MYADGQNPVSEVTSTRELLQKLLFEVYTIDGDDDLSSRHHSSSSSVPHSVSTNSSIWDVSTTSSNSGGGGGGAGSSSSSSAAPMSTSPASGSKGRGAVGLRMRDLSRISFFDNASNADLAVLVRRHAVLLFVDPLRVIVTANRVVLVLPPEHTESAAVDILKDHMSGEKRICDLT